MFGRNSHKPHRLRRAAAALVAGAVALAGIGVVAGAQSATAASLCDILPERCPTLPTLSLDPYGALDVPTFGRAAVRVTGWASDLSVNAPIDVLVTIDGTLVSRSTALLPRAGVGNRGFDVTVPASPASAQVCVTGVNVGAGRDALIGCARFPYSTAFTLLDQCGAVSLPLTALKWALAAPTGQTLVDVSTSNAGRAGFVSGPTVPGSLVGMSLSTSAMPGPLFRSVPTSALPANPTGGLNVVVPCPIRFTPAQLNALLTSVPFVPPAGITIGSATVTPGAGTMTLNVSGTATGSVGLVGYREPFTYSLTFTVAPSMNMNNPAEVVLVSPTGPGTLTFTGGMGWFLNPFVAPAMEPNITSSVLTGLQSGVNAAITSAVAAGFPGGLPAGATISMPRLTVTSSGASATPAIGWFS